MIRPEIKINKASPLSKPLPPCEPGPVTLEQPVAKKKRIAPTLIATVQTTTSTTTSSKNSLPKKTNDAEAATSDLVGAQAPQNLNNHKRPVEDTTEAVDNLTIDPVQNKKQKKRIQPTLLVS
jgi:hypothetical protein